MANLPVKVKDLRRIRKRLIRTRTSFTDVSFPPNKTSIYKAPNDLLDPEWRRPSQIVPVPCLFRRQMDQLRVKPGMIGNKWLGAVAVAALRDERYLKQIFPKFRTQGWQGFQRPNEHPGIFHFRLWKFDRWRDVIIDDKLPVMADTGSVLFYRSASNKEFWISLLEKAMAK